ncbi:MAG: hypothetical protein HY719_06690 [Planctomycetes bacterium]|nr:hypothetical protein [Planctomycetota bacterium]
MKTVKVKIRAGTSDEARMSREAVSKKAQRPELAGDRLSLFEKFMSDVHDMREELYKRLYEQYSKNPLTIEQYAVKVDHGAAHGRKSKPLTRKDSSFVSAPFACLECRQQMIVAERDRQGKSGKPKKEYVGRCPDATHLMEIVLKKRKVETDSSGTGSPDENELYEPGKYSSQDLYNKYVAREFANKGAERGLSKVAPGWVGIVYEAAGAEAAKSVCSFLEKRRTAFNENRGTHSDNLDKQTTLGDTARKVSEPAFEEELPKEILPNRRCIEDANDAIARINMWTNEKMRQKHEVPETLAPMLKRLKGFPSFPVAERSAILRLDFAGEFAKYRDETRAEIASGEGAWARFSPDDVRVVAAAHLPYSHPLRCGVEGRNAPHAGASRPIGGRGRNVRTMVGEHLAWLIEQSTHESNGTGAGGVVETRPFDRAWKRGLSGKTVFEGIVDHGMGVVARVWKHISETVSGRDDIQSRRRAVDWLRALANLAHEGLRRDDFAGYTRKRLLFDKRASDLKAVGTIRENDRVVFEILGFSPQGAKPKRGAALLRGKRPSEGGRACDRYDYFLGLDYRAGQARRGVRFRFNSKDGEFEGLFQDTKTKSSRWVPTVVNADQVLLLPLEFGSRQHGNFIDPLDFAFEDGSWHLNNARLIREADNGVPAYFVALTYSRRLMPARDAVPDRRKAKAIVGVDRGEKIPVVAAICDGEGRLIEYRRIGEGHFQKQLEIQREKEESQRATGAYRASLRNRAANIADATVKEAAAVLFALAHEREALVVLEDLSRGFGRSGRRTLMALRQYTRLEDALVSKLRYEGLFTADTLLTNCAHGPVAKVTAPYTSTTCSGCGEPHASANGSFYFENLIREDSGFRTRLTNGKEVSLDFEYQYWAREERKMRTANVSERLREILGDREANDVAATTREKAQSLLRRALSPRVRQADYRCPNCGHEANADEQAALNIARRWLFVNGSPEHNGYKKRRDSTEGVETGFVDAWKAFYERMLKTEWAT